MPVQPRNSEDRLELGLRWVAGGCVSIVVLLAVLVPIGIDRAYRDNSRYGDERETRRVTSPSGKIDAVLVSRRSGMLTSVVSDVWLTPKDQDYLIGKPIAALYGAKFNGTYDVRLSWEKGKRLSRLRMEFEEAHSALAERTVTFLGEAVLPELSGQAEAQGYHAD
jgi:hypothetical protein